jgi:hypothetical protein
MFTSNLYISYFCIASNIKFHIALHNVHMVNIRVQRKLSVLRVTPMSERVHSTGHILNVPEVSQ